MTWAARRRGFVAAARSTGTPPLRVLLRHLLPAALTPVTVDTALRIGDLILIEAALYTSVWACSRPHRNGAPISVQRGAIWEWPGGREPFLVLQFWLLFWRLTCWETVFKMRWIRD